MTEGMIWFLVGLILLMTHSWFIMQNRADILRLKNHCGLPEAQPDDPHQQSLDDYKASLLEIKLSEDMHDKHDFPDES